MEVGLQLLQRHPRAGEHTCGVPVDVHHRWCCIAILDRELLRWSLHANTQWMQSSGDVLREEKTFRACFNLARFHTNIRNIIFCSSHIYRDKWIGTVSF